VGTAALMVAALLFGLLNKGLQKAAGSPT